MGTTIETTAATAEPLNFTQTEEERQAFLERTRPESWGEKPEGNLQSDDYITAARDAYVDFTPGQNGDEIPGILIDLDSLTYRARAMLGNERYFSPTHAARSGDVAPAPYVVADTESGDDLTFFILQGDAARFESARDTADLLSPPLIKPAAKPVISAACPEDAICDGLSRSEVHHAVMQQAMPYLTTLYSSYASRFAATHGRGMPEGGLSVRFTVASDGTVASAKIEASTLPFGTQFEEAVAGRMARMQFPKPQGDGIAVVDYDLYFSGE